MGRYSLNSYSLLPTSFGGPLGLQDPIFIELSTVVIGEALWCRFEGYNTHVFILSIKRFNDLVAFSR